MWCATDWVLPEEFYPNGTGGLRQRLGMPLMLYLPSVCVAGGIWAGKYNWSDTAAQGWLLPVVPEAKQFFVDLFTYGFALAAKGSPGPDQDPWPGVWAPPMVRAAWQGTNMAAYETDFWHNLMTGYPDLRQTLAPQKNERKKTEGK